MCYKKLAYSLIEYIDNIQLNKDYDKLINCYKEYLNIYSTNKNYSSFSHIFVKDITIIEPKKDNKAYIQFSIYADEGDRYEKIDIQYIKKLVEKLLNKSIKMKSENPIVIKFFNVTSITY